MYLPLMRDPRKSPPPLKTSGSLGIIRSPTGAPLAPLIGTEKPHQNLSTRCPSTEMSNNNSRQGSGSNKEIRRAASSATAAGQIISQRTVEKNIVVPSGLTRTESRLARTQNDASDETVRVRERIVEVAKPVAQERVIEVNEVEFFETSVEFSETGYEEKIKEVARVELEEEIVEVPKIIEVEKIVEVPEIEYHEIPVEKIVEVVEYEDQIITKEVPVDEYVEVLVHQDKLVHVEKSFERNLPEPVEVISEWQFRMPVLKPLRKVVPLEVRIPRFIEVPVPSAYLSAAELGEAQELQQKLQSIVTGGAASLIDMETLSQKAAERADLLRSAESAATAKEIKEKLTAQLHNLGKEKTTKPGVRYMDSLLNMSAAAPMMTMQSSL